MLVKKLLTVLIFGLALLGLGCRGVWAGQRKALEKVYQAQWCAERGGQLEVVYPDRSRCDCETKTHAVEVEFAYKWKEAVGQALLYWKLSGKLPGILLILEDPKDEIYLSRLRKAVEGVTPTITIWVVRNY